MHYPWQQVQWDRITNAKIRHRMPHGVLLTGPLGTGKLEFAEAVAAMMLCESDEAEICGVCKSCKLRINDSHPDLSRVMLEDKSKQIKVEQIRQLNQFISKTGQQGQYKVAIISPADHMNISAANALLKTLEEPAAHSLIILIDNNNGRVLPTIRSRCQVFEFPKPSFDESMAWLKNTIESVSVSADEHQLTDAWRLADGKPKVALQVLQEDLISVSQSMLSQIGQLVKLQDTPISIAEKWRATELSTILQWNINWLQQIIRFRETGVEDYIQEQDIHRRMFVYLASKAKSDALFAFLDHLVDCLGMLTRGTNPNDSLMIENILIRWQQLIR